MTDGGLVNFACPNFPCGRGDDCLASEPSRYTCLGSKLDAGSDSDSNSRFAMAA